MSTTEQVLLGRRIRIDQPCNILGMHVHATTYEEASEQIIDWAEEGGPRMVCASNVHMTMETYDNPEFRQIINGADLVTADGVPLVWAQRLLGISDATRVYGPDLTLHVCRAAAREGVPIALYGGTPESLNVFEERLGDDFPGIRIVCKIAPPFRPPTEQEDADDTAAIVASGAKIVLVGIGCPKQERWIAAHLDRIDAVMLGVGAAFDFLTGRVRQAPGWMQSLGLEWLFRLAMEPRRLWKRYFKHNPRFVGLLCWQLVSRRPSQSIQRPTRRPLQSK